MNGVSKSASGKPISHPRGEHGTGLDPADAGDSSRGGEGEGLSSGGASTRDGEWPNGVTPPASRDRLPGRHSSRIPGQDIDPDALLASFETGDPIQVYHAFRTLIGAYREVSREAAHRRFQVHFGTSRCDSCEGLKAGPGVLATCFQVKACNYTNVKETSIPGRHLKVLERMSHNTNPLDTNSTKELGISITKATNVGSAQQTDEAQSSKQNVKETGYVRY